MFVLARGGGANRYQYYMLCLEMHDIEIDQFLPLAGLYRVPKPKVVGYELEKKDAGFFSLTIGVKMSQLIFS